MELTPAGQRIKPGILETQGAVLFSLSLFPTAESRTNARHYGVSWITDDVALLHRCLHPTVPVSRLSHKCDANRSEEGSNRRRRHLRSSSRWPPSESPVGHFPTDFLHKCVSWRDVTNDR